MQLDAGELTRDYKSIFQSSAFFSVVHIPFLQRGIIDYVEIYYPNVLRKSQRSRLTRRFDAGNKVSLSNVWKRDFRKYILLDIR